MPEPREVLRSGIHSLSAVTALLQRGRDAHPTKGLYEAADVQWWWARERPTDAVEQLFWFDGKGDPEAAAIITDWGESVALQVITLPGATPDWVRHVAERGLAHAAAAGFGKVQTEVDRDDDVLLSVLGGYGFVIEEPEELVESWMQADARPAISSLADGYRLCSRADTVGGAHHTTSRLPADAEQRLNQTSLYRADLDLFVQDSEGNLAANGLCWFDPITKVGLVEPMRTEDAHQRRGLARHVLTAGIHRLVDAGADRIKICYHSDNPASGHLYRSVGFVPTKHTDVHVGRTATG